MKNLEHVQSPTHTTQVVARTTLVIAAAFALPFLVHLLPFGGSVPIGARLLPIFYVPLLAAFWNLRVAGLFTIAMPFINMAITGNPVAGLALIMTIEVALFLTIAWQLVSKDKLNRFAGPLAYLGAKTVSATLIALAMFMGVTEIAPLDFAANSVLNGIPGLFVLMVIGYLLAGWKRD